MTIGLGELPLEEAAREAAGNWRMFPCFCWNRAGEFDDADLWAIIYSHHRDSRLLDLSNAEATSKALEPFIDADDPDVAVEHHGHFAVGWIDGYAIRVFRDGQITGAFKAYHELAERLAEYPVLDEEDYSRREYEATIANIADAARPLRDEYDLTDGFEGEAFSWLWDHNQRAVESRDDQGGYPSEDDLRAAFDGLGYEQLDG